jgi:hypothetical protein
LNIPSETSHQEKWILPLTMTNRGQGDFESLAPDAWLTEPNMVLENVAENEDWVILNIQQMGLTT